MKMFYTAMIAISSLALNHAAVAEEHGELIQGLQAERSMQRVARVEAIDLETREVTLNDGSEPFTFVAGDEVVNLPQVEVGDLVVAEYVESVDIKAWTGEHGDAGAGEIAALAAAKEGEKPGMVAVDTRVVTATIESIDTENAAVALKGPEGNVQHFRAANPANLEKVSVGDLVIATFSQAIAVSVVAADDE